MVGQVTRLASLISHGCDPFVTEIIFCVERVVHFVGGRLGHRKCSEVGAAGGWEIIRSEGQNSIRIGGIPSGIVNVSGECVDVREIPRRC